MEDKTLVVAHCDGKAYIGWIHEETELIIGRPVQMYDVRTLDVHLEVDPISKQLMRGAVIGHVDMFSGPVPSLPLIPVLAYAPEGEDEKRLLAMIEVAKEHEETASAREAGVWVPH